MPAVHDHDRHAGAGGVPDEAQPRHHRQRRPGDQHAPRASSTAAERPVDPLRRHVLAEEHHMRLERAAAAPAADQPEPGGVLELDVAVRRRLDVEAVPEAGIAFVEPLVQLQPAG